MARCSHKLSSGGDWTGKAGPASRRRGLRGLMAEGRAPIFPAASCSEAVPMAPMSGKGWKFSKLLLLFTFNGCLQKIFDGPVEKLRLLQVRHMAGLLDCHELPARIESSHGAGLVDRH